MRIEQDRLYGKSHEWAKLSGDGTAEVGISDFAQDALGDLVFVNLPAVRDSFQPGDVLCDVESVKAVSDVYAIVGGTVTEVNEALADAPEKLNEDAFGAWLCRLENVSVPDDLMSAEQYEAFCREQH